MKRCPKEEMLWHGILITVLHWELFQIAATFSETYGIPPTDFFLSCVLPNQSSNYSLATGNLRNINTDDHFLTHKWNFSCTFSTDYTCCLWDCIDTDCSREDKDLALRNNNASLFASDMYLIDFTWRLHCQIPGSTRQLTCKIQFLSETNTTSKQYRVIFHFAVVLNREVGKMAECICHGNETCKCIILSVMLDHTYVFWIEFLSGMISFQSPLISVNTSNIVKPDAPTELQADIIEHGKLKLSWTKPVSVPYGLQYEVKSSWHSGEKVSQMYLLVNTTSVIIDNIQPCMQLILEVRCRNHIGVGIWSEWSDSWVFDSQNIFYFPQKLMVSRGSRASVSCFYCDKGTRVPANDLTWWLNLAEKIPEHQYTVVNDYIGQVTIENLNTTKPKGKFLYDVLHCCIKTDECQQRYAEIYVIDISISILCETNGNQTAMVCRWSTENITVPAGSILQFRYFRNNLYCSEKDITDDESISKDCQLQNENLYECSFQSIYLLSGYTMWIEIYHPLGTLYSPPVCIIPADVVKPFAVSRVKAEITDGDGHLYVSWKRPPLPAYDLQFQLQYGVRGTATSRTIVDIVEGQSARIALSDPCVSYTVQIRSKRIDDTGYWSDWSIPVHTVLKDVRAPQKGPDFWRIVKTDKIEKGDNVTLMWQPLQREQSLCSVGGYEIQYQISENARWSIYIGNITKYTFTLSSDILTVTVVAINSLGYSALNNKLTFSHEMSKVNIVQTFRVYLINSSCAVAVWTLLPSVSNPSELVVEWQNLREDPIKWIFVPSNISRYYINDYFFAIERYRFRLYPIFPDGVGSPHVTYEFSKVSFIEQNDTGLYVILPIIVLSSLLLLGTLLISHQRMKQMFWKEVPNPKHCSWAQGVNFQKPDTLENLFIKHHRHLTMNPPFLMEPESDFQDLSIDNVLQSDDKADMSEVNGLFTKAEDPDYDSACATSQFDYGDDPEETIYKGSASQSSVKYATIVTNSQQDTQYSNERKTSTSSFDGCFLGNNAIVIGNREEEKKAFLIAAGLQPREPNKTSSRSIASSEGFSEPCDHDGNFLDEDNLERNLYYMALGSMKEREHTSYFSDKPLVSYAFQDNILYQEIDFMKDRCSELIENDYALRSSVKKAFLSYMPQFQTQSVKLQGDNESL
ncbi:leptin receptor [Bombina bombina]|uniref:leptin receptor n=1 Tax=Bombina bombina TaxID=8345 RepID=UPI00235AFC20|nr:leptin receptor [Bombina bombina]